MKLVDSEEGVHLKNTWEVSPIRPRAKWKIYKEEGISNDVQITSLDTCRSMGASDGEKGRGETGWGTGGEKRSSSAPHLSNGTCV